MAVGKNKRISKGKKGGKKKAADPFAKKDWYDIKAPSVFAVKNVGKTLVTRTQGTKIASEGLKHRVFEISMADLQDDEDHAYRKIRLRAEDVQGRNVLTNFWGMDFTTDKLRSLVRKWQTMIEAHVDVKTTDSYSLRMFCIGFTKRRQNQVKRTCYAQSSQIRQIRRKMREIMINQASSCDLKELVRKFIPESIGIPTCQSITAVKTKHSTHKQKKVMDMAIKANLSVLALSLLIIGIFSSSPSIALQTSRPTSSKWTPRFLGGHSKPLSQNRQQQPQYQYETRYFSQPLDHFSFSDLPSFPQRYLISTEHWVGAQRLGPIFFYCGNEGDIEWFAANTGFVWEIAPRFGAMVVFPEHRYYGKSMPYGSRDEAYKNATTLSYLTAEQALADFAVLLRELKRDLSAEVSPVVLFGGSYGGMLAAWMRLKYPHVAVGALASSAPILQFEDIVPPETFYDIVSGAFKRESTSCFNTIKESWDVLISESLKNDGLLQLTKTFHLCRTLKRTEDLRDWLDSAYSYLAMVNYPYSSDFLMPLPGHPIREVCRKIDGCPHGTSILERIFEGVSVYYNYTGGVDCFQLDDDPHGMDGWNWQACTEMVMPMSSSRDASMYPTYDYNHSSFQEECWKEFKVKPRPRWITTEFGGHDIKTALKKFGSNIIFSNGLLDPWSGGSVLQNVSETIVALVTEEGAHHIDLRASSSEDPDWLLEQRATEIKLIKGWISDYYEEKKAIIDM